MPRPKLYARQLKANVGYREAAIVDFFARQRSTTAGDVIRWAILHEWEHSDEGSREGFKEFVREEFIPALDEDERQLAGSTLATMVDGPEDSMSVFYARPLEPGRARPLLDPTGDED